ncbi:MAG: glycosyltransferase family 2 protein [Deltaproteobacteria bacterium]|nr:glycosyltransferase family 2 protein [Deltaproteobacteria bacterium]
MNKISVYIIAYNQESKIGDAVRSVLWADEIVLVDSYSGDRTAQIASELGARVVQVEFKGFGDLRNQAVAACTHDWIFSLDSDERCTPEARDEILQVINAPDARDAYFMPRRNFFMGRWMRHSGYYPDYRQPQLFRKGAVVYRQDEVHEGYDLQTDTAPGYLKKAIWQVPFENFAERLQKIQRYSDLGAVKLRSWGDSATMGKALSHATWAFFHTWLIKGGILDGWAGFMISLGNFEEIFYKYAKLCELLADWKEPGTEPLYRK